MGAEAPAFGSGTAHAWSPERPRLRASRLVAAWLISALALLAATEVIAGAEVRDWGGALVVAALVAVLNAILPPIVAALRIPFVAVVGFLAVLVLDAGMLLIAADIAPERLQIDGWGPALAVGLLTAAVSMALAAVAGVDDDDAYTLGVARRVARRVSKPTVTGLPGILFLEIDGLAAPVLSRAIRDGNVPNIARWIEEDGYRLEEWETDLSSQTGASQAGILLGDNDDVPAFRWVDKEARRVVSCSNPRDCAQIEAAHSVNGGLVANGGTSRGNLLSGGADAAILTVSRLSEEKRPNPGYRAFLANGSNVTRTLVLFVWEVVLELIAATRQRRRDVRPRGHRGGTYPLLRAGVCVWVRDVVVFSVLQDMFSGVPAVYATFAGYDEVAHHSGLERPDTLETLRKLDDRLGLIARARRYAPRPYEIVVLSDHGQTQGATFLQRNGYGLDELVARSLGGADVAAIAGSDENHGAVARAADEATGHPERAEEREPVDAGYRDAIVLGSGNLGLIYLMRDPHRLTLEEIERRHPGLMPTLCGHPHIAFALVRSSEHGALAVGAEGTRRLADGAVCGHDPLDGFPANAARHLLRTDGFPHVADIVVNSFHDPVTDEGCAFEELISFHGGLGGPQSRPFLLFPDRLPAPTSPVVGAAAVHHLLTEWREVCNSGLVPAPAARA